MYSERVQNILKSKDLKAGDRVSVEKAGKVFEGLLMPRPDVGDSECIVLKLDSGYNIGLKFEQGVKIEKSGHREPKAVREEEEFELGKVKQKHLEIKFDKKKPAVSLIATGGTIGSRVDYKTGGVFPLMKPEEFLFNVPELAEIANMESILSPFSKNSEDMNHKDWTVLAELAAKELNRGAQGVLVTHGTDTLHFTAAALSFFLRDLHKPVVLVGSQRSSDRGSSDSGMNLICAAHAATSNIGEVGVCMHGTSSDDYCLFTRGTKVRKMHTSRRDAFRPINELPLAKIWPDGRIEVVNKNFRERKDGKVGLDTKFEPKVAILKAYPGSDPDLIDMLLSKGYKGFVIEGTGLGHVPTFAEKEWISTIKRAVKDGIPFVVTSQTLYGRVNPNVYTSLRVLYHETGAIPGQDLTTETAYVKLGWILGHTKDLEQVRRMMATNYAGEITERSEPEAFLY